MLQFRDLTVWQKGMNLAERVYACSEKFSRSEMYGLTSQVRRAAVSIPSNIAEGKAIGGQSYPSAREDRSWLRSGASDTDRVSAAIKLLRDAEAAELMKHASQVGRMLVALLNSLPKD